MRTLALETTERIGSVAALEAGRLLSQQTLPDDQRSAQSLVPAIGALLKDVGWNVPEIDLIAVIQGPGSFTGLRVGVTAAKTLAYAAGADVVGVNTLEVIARQADAVKEKTGKHGETLWSVMDAQRRQLFAARFVHDGSWNMVEPTAIIDEDEWLARLAPGDTSTESESAVPRIFATGPALRRLANKLPDGVAMADEECWAPKAANVGRLGVARFEAGQRDDVWSLVPNYFRKSAAEEKWNAKQ